MHEERSSEEITEDAIKMVNRFVNAEVPIPDCPQKKLRAKWKRDRILIDVARKIAPGSGGMEIVVTVE